MCLAFEEANPTNAGFPIGPTFLWVTQQMGVLLLFLLVAQRKELPQEEKTTDRPKFGLAF